MLDWTKLGPQGLIFFGKISASVSHEIKNVLAVVNENAGLLEDMVLLAGQGGDLNLERLAELTRRIQSNIGRGDTIVKRMNRFAHSVDHLQGQVDLGEVVGLMVNMAERLAAQNEVKLTARHEESVLVTTHPYFLEHLLFLCLVHSMEQAQKNAEIEVRSGREGDMAQVQFAGVTSAPGEELLKQAEPSLAALQATLKHDPQKESLVVQMPVKISSG